MRRSAVIVSVALAGLLPALPAFAHGAPIKPNSRSAACATGGDDAGAAACKAAVTANGGPFGNFDNLRVANVNGRDREVVPDGKLCSGGLADFKGLDLARADWPATTLTAGGTLAMQYRATIPHQGSFRIYFTKQGYDPTEPLSWGDLAGKPVLDVSNPPLRDGAYRMTVKIPKDLVGRHMLYTVWQTTSTPDTYYSCSDVVIKAPTVASGAAPAVPKGATSPKVTRTKQPQSSATAEAAADPVAQPPAQPAAHQSWLTKTSDDGNAALGHQILAAALVVVAGVLAWAGLGRLRRMRRADAGGTQRTRRRPGNR
jgi:chitin-binding protein